jgi:hypothetical protein
MLPDATTRAPARFQAIPLERNLIGLQSSDSYLCAEQDGRVTLARSARSAWEAFVTSDIRQIPVVKNEPQRDSSHDMARDPLEFPLVFISPAWPPLAP